MTKQAKTVAATKAAPKKVQPRAEFVELANNITAATQSLNSILYDGAMMCRKFNATEEELKLVLDAAPKQRRSEFKTIVTAPEGAITKTAPKSLGKLAQFIKARNKGATPQVAKQFAEQKLNAAELNEKLGIAPKDGGKPKGAQKRADTDKPPFDMLHAAVEALRKEYADSEQILSMIGDLTDMVADIEEAAKDA